MMDDDGEIPSCLSFYGSLLACEVALKCYIPSGNLT